VSFWDIFGQPWIFQLHLMCCRDGIKHRGCHLVIDMCPLSFRELRFELWIIYVHCMLVGEL